MPTDDERPTDDVRQAYINQWAAEAADNPPTASAIRLHKLLAKYDLGVEKATMDLRSAIKDGPLDEKTIELLYILGYTLRGFSQQNIEWHTRAALRAGATPEEILHTLELLLIIDGMIPFMRGMDAWAEVTGLEGIEPTNGKLA